MIYYLNCVLWMKVDWCNKKLSNIVETENVWGYKNLTGPIPLDNLSNG